MCGMVTCPEDGCDFESSEQGLAVHKGKIHPTEDTDGLQCPSCENYYKRIGVHWTGSDCSHPELSDFQKEVAIGMLLGDGYIETNDAASYGRLETAMVNRPFVEWMDEVFGIVSTGIKETYTTESRRELPSINESLDYDNVYRWRTRRHPFFEELRQWYDTGKKRFPEDLDLTPTVAKVWYCCDGTLQEDFEARIYSHNEIDRLDVLTAWFDEVDFTPRIGEGYIYFTSEETKRFLDWMGAAPSGFGYKWNHKDVRQPIEEGDSKTPRGPESVGG